MFVRTLLATAATILFAHPTSAQAQFRSEFAAMLGAYLPTNQVHLKRYFTGAFCTDYPENPDCGGGPPPVLPRWPENRGVVVGARWTGWLGKGAGIEGSFWWASGGGIARTFLSSVRGAFRFAPDAQTSVVLLAGPAMINRSGYRDDMVSFGGTVGVGLDVYPGHKFAIRAQIEDYMYSVQPRDREALFQQDFVLSLSVALVDR